VVIDRSVKGGPGRRAPAFVLRGAASLLIGLVAGPTAAQQPAPAPAVQPVPSALELSKMVWSTMLAIDHANRAGNYSVLRDLGSPGFQANNDAAQLATVFASIRQGGIDLSNTVLLAPTYSAAPAIIAPGVLRVQGTFGLRPTGISFDLYYQWDAARWKLFGVSIVPIEMPRVQPGLPTRR
jgi:hypothetical protein